MITLKQLAFLFASIAIIAYVNISTYEKVCDINYEFPQARAGAEISTFICESSTSWEIRDRQMLNGFSNLGL